MPFLIPAFAAVVGAISTAGVAIAGTVGTFLGGGAFGAAIANGIVALTGGAGFLTAVSAWSTVSMLASTALTHPPRIGVSDTGGTQVTFQANPNAAVSIILGRTGTAGTYVHQTTDGQAAKNAHLMRPVILSFGPVRAIESFTAGDITVTFDSEIATGGTAADGSPDNRYAGKMAMRYQLGAKPSPEFAVPWVPLNVPEWTSAHRLSGYAAAWWGLEFDSTGKTYPTGTPAPMWTVDGRPVYDPRLDSTYPGGSGPCRPDDDTTWVFEGNDNAGLVGLTWCLGHYANGKRILGMGLPLTSLDVDAFIQFANVCEANGWTMGGMAYSSDRKWDVLRAILQGASGEPVLGPKVSCFINAPRTSLATITGDDIVGEASVTGTQARRDRFNSVIARYRSEEHGWQMVPAQLVEVDTYVEEDGGRRTREIEYPLCQDKDVAAQLAAYDIVNSREFGPIILPAKPKYAGYVCGDCLTVDEPELGLNGQKVLILNRDFDPVSGVVTLTCRSETDAKHDFALGRTGVAPPTPGLTGIDLGNVSTPDAESWTAAGSYIQGPGGARIPIILVTGQVDDPAVSQLIVEYRERLTAEPTFGAWAQEVYAGSARRMEIRAVKPGGTYGVRIRHKTIRGIEDEDAARDLGLVTVGSLISDDTANVGKFTAKQIEQAVDEFAATVAAVEAVAAEAERLDELIDDQVGKLKEAVSTSLDETRKGSYATIKEALGRGRALSLERERSYVDGAAPGAVFRQISTITDDLATFDTMLASTVDDNRALYDAFVTTQATVNTATASSLTTLSAEVGTNKASYDAFVTTQATANSALSSSITALDATVGKNKAAYEAFVVAQATTDSAITSSITTLTATVGTNKSSVETFVAAQTTTNSTLAAATTALASSFETFQATVESTYATQATIDSALSTFDTSVKAWVDKSTTGGSKVAALAEANYSAIVDATGQLYGSIGFKATAGGVVTGMRLYAESGATDYSAIVLRAGNVLFEAAEGSGSTITPFSYNSASGTLFVDNLTIRRGNIQGAAISTCVGYDSTGHITLSTTAVPLSTSLSINCGSGADVFVDTFVYAENTHATSGQDIVIAVYRNGSFVSQKIFHIAPANQNSISWPFLDPNLTGSNSYQIQATATPGGSDCYVTQVVSRANVLFKTGPGM